jgi:hypothetical protein
MITYRAALPADADAVTAFRVCAAEDSHRPPDSLAACHSAPSS